MESKTQPKIGTIAAAKDKSKDKSVEIKQKCKRWFIEHYFQTPEINQAKASADPADSLRKCAVESRRGTGKDDIYVETLAGGKIAFYIKPDTSSGGEPTAIFNIRQLTKMMAETFASAAPPDAEEIFSEDKVFSIHLDNIVPSPFEPQARRRTKFKSEEIESLGDSIVTDGLLSPIIVRPLREVLLNRPGNSAMYEIAAGERRWAAHKCKNLKKIKCFIRELTDAQVLTLQYRENHDRLENDPLDDAFLFQFLIDRENYTEEMLADRFAKPRREITEKLKLGDLVEAAKSELSSGALPLRHAYYLAKFPAASQKEIVAAQLAYKYHDRDEKAVSYHEFKAEVEEVILRRLHDAPFAKDDPRLHVRGLLCRDCPDNSAFSTMLFPELADEPRCLNKSCFEVKTTTHLRLQRDTIAAQLPNPTNMPAEEIAVEIPLVTERKYTNDRSPFAEKVLTGQALLDAPECEFSELSLAVEGAKKGRQVYICRNDGCPVHHPKPPEQVLEDLSDDELTQYETDFDKEVERRVRRKILGAAMEWFDHFKSFWAFDDLVKNLIASVLFERASASDGDVVLQLVRGFKNAPKNFKDRDRLREFVETLDKTNQSRILFLLSAADASDEVELLKIAADYTTLNFLHLDAETRLELAPPIFKAQAQEYLEAVKSGNICDVPRLSRTAGSYDFVETVFDDSK